MSLEHAPKDDLANEILDGVPAYAKYTGFTPRRCYYLLGKGLLPGKKFGRKWLGNKVAVRQRLLNQASNNS